MLQRAGAAPHNQLVKVHGYLHIDRDGNPGELGAPTGAPQHRATTSQYSNTSQHTPRAGSTPYNTVPYNTVPYNTPPYNTPQNNRLYSNKKPLPNTSFSNRAFRGRRTSLSDVSEEQHQPSSNTSSVTNTTATRNTNTTATRNTSTPYPATTTTASTQYSPNRATPYPSHCRRDSDLPKVLPYYIPKVLPLPCYTPKKSLVCNSTQYSPDDSVEETEGGSLIDVTENLVQTPQEFQENVNPNTNNFISQNAVS